MDGTFLKVEKDKKFEYEIAIKFINPSIVDFLIHELRENSGMIKNSILTSICTTKISKI